MKQIAAILLTLIVCFNTVGYFFVFKVKELQIKTEVKRLIKGSVPEDQLVVIRLTPENRSDFIWIHGKEFRFRESMYDVVKLKGVSAGVTDYYCLKDDRETGLFNHLNSLVKEMMNGNNQIARVNKLFSVFLAGLFPPVPNNIDFISVEKPVMFNFHTIIYSYLHFSIIPHPPKS
ncbi:MAG: hypothetical protein V1775_15115 [Bacteroidota bacterium]